MVDSVVAAVVGDSGVVTDEECLEAAEQAVMRVALVTTAEGAEA